MKNTPSVDNKNKQFRIFVGDDLYHIGEYDSNGKVRKIFHNNLLTERLEKILSERLNAGAETIIAENSNTGLYKV